MLLSTIFQYIVCKFVAVVNTVVTLLIQCFIFGATFHIKSGNYDLALVWFFMVFKTTFNNISAILWRSVILEEETGVPGENHQSATSY